MSSIKFGFGKKSDDIDTPPELYKLLNEEFNFDHDPCPRDFEVDALHKDTEWGQRNYVNPPFSRIKPFIKKAIKESKKGKMSVILMPARTGAKYWHKKVYPYAREIRHFKGGFKFPGYKRITPFHVSLVVIPANATKKNVSVSKEKYNWVSVIPQ